MTVIYIYIYVNVLSHIQSVYIRKHINIHNVHRWIIKWIVDQVDRRFHYNSAIISILLKEIEVSELVLRPRTLSNSFNNIRHWMTDEWFHKPDTVHCINFTFRLRILANCPRCYTKIVQWLNLMWNCVLVQWVKGNKNKKGLYMSRLVYITWWRNVIDTSIITQGIINENMETHFLYIMVSINLSVRIN